MKIFVDGSCNRVDECARSVLVQMLKVDTADVDARDVAPELILSFVDRLLFVQQPALWTSLSCFSL